MKQFKMILLLIATPMFLLSGGCRVLEHENIEIVNQSKSPIVFQPDILSSDLTNEDILFQCQKGARGVKPYSSSHLPALTNSDWERDLSGTSFLKVLIFDDETYGCYITKPCDTIRKYVPVLQWYQLTLENLKQLNFSITYPPTEAMKNMKIYPPYKEK